MSMLDVHREALFSINEAYHNFLLKYSHNSKTLYGIVEGKDDLMFYRGILDRFIPEDWVLELILAGNKRKVIDFNNSLNWASFAKARIVCFVDRDLQEFGVEPIANGENVYITDGYSVENFIVTADVFRRLLSEAYNVVDYTNDEISALEELFVENLCSFQDNMVPIMAQIIGWRIDKTDASLKNLDLSEMFEFSDGLIHLKERYRESNSRISYLARCAGAPSCDAPRLVALDIQFRSQEGPRRYTRGKYLIWFFSHILTHLHSNISLFVAAYAKSPKAKLPVGPSNLMILAAPRVRIPNSLKMFIEETFLAYIALTAG
jgi:hypothetical protein